MAQVPIVLCPSCRCQISLAGLVPAPVPANLTSGPSGMTSMPVSMSTQPVIAATQPELSMLPTGLLPALGPTSAGPLLSQNSWQAREALQHREPTGPSNITLPPQRLPMYPLPQQEHASPSTSLANMFRLDLSASPSTDRTPSPQPTPISFVPAPSPLSTASSTCESPWFGASPTSASVIPPATPDTPFSAASSSSAIKSPTISLDQLFTSACAALQSPGTNEDGQTKGKAKEKGDSQKDDVTRDEATMQARQQPQPKAQTIGRPPNAFILYRSDQMAAIRERGSDATGVLRQAEISRSIGLMWREEKPEVRKKYETLAEIAKLKHSLKYPDFKITLKREPGNRGKGKTKSSSSNSNNMARKSRPSSSHGSAEESAGASPDAAAGTQADQGDVMALLQSLMQSASGGTVSDGQGDIHVGDR